MSTPPAGDAPGTGKRDNHTPSCTVCQRRKVKCDRVFPCAPCKKTGLQCEFKPRDSRGRKRVKYTHDDDSRIGANRIGRVQVDDPEGQRYSSATDEHARRRKSSQTEHDQAENARLVTHDGAVRYVNNHLWGAISPPKATRNDAAAGATTGTTPSANSGSLHRSPRGVTGNSIYENAVSSGYELAKEKPTRSPQYDGGAERHFLFSESQRLSVPRQIHQPPANITIQLWQTYLSNVDPLMKVCHAPTVQQTILGQIGRPAPPPPLQALASAIYFISVASLQDDECQALLHIPRSELLTAYRRMTEDALSAAGFVTSTELAVLQAFVLYLAALRSIGDNATVWSLAGVAIRVAGTMGLARDGSVLRLPPFESEMRRRLWFALVYLDARTAELVGQDGDLLVQNYDVHLPANLNDSQLFPDMQRLPESKPGATEMVYVMFRAIVPSTIKSTIGLAGAGGTWKQMRASGIPATYKATVVEALESMFNEEFLSFCDPTVPLQRFTMNAVQTILTKFRLVGNISPSRSPVNADPADVVSENEFEQSMKMMQLQLDLFLDPSLQKWRWHWQGQFQWYALAVLIRQTRLREPSAKTSRAWGILRQVFDTVMPTLELAPHKSPLLSAIRELFNSAAHGQDTSNATPATIKFGSTPASAVATPSTWRPGTTPHNALLPGMSASVSTPAPATNLINGIGDFSLNLDFDAIDWAEFDRLTTELCGQPTG
ncbi:hypothetical protein BAUCODRAFT_37934 [Baudoinia panamericana UAMH 10762]|uniref:Zn(2)-C6 fungal-type domain-containing protein n=1 Tax=Baudoinia panamericana (strain UAMH 10762) TaxID=717646 RepID=M2M9F0_BAUPA|nr:uncharacterized protein BAUCODRAFT_37934 [Baudoinia panamericana UAMH 10762]EMC93006.1 hypothetical protein BAUCODRAFT_37934 [Baudoinia panamericana UAMH 10762]